MPQVNLTFDQVKEAISHLGVRERHEIARQFSRDALMVRLHDVMARIRKGVARKGFTEEQIPDLIKKVRQEARLAEKSRRSH